MPFLSVTNSKQIFECIQHGVIITDLRGRILHANPATLKIFGYELDQIKDLHIRKLYGDEDSTTFKHVLRSCVEEDEVRGKWHGLRRDGEKVWLDVRGKMLETGGGLVGCVISLVPINRLILTEQRLKEKEEFSHAIFDDISDVIITYDENGVILSSNKAVENLFGYKPQELEGVPLTKLLSFPFSEEMTHSDSKKDYQEFESLTETSREIQGKDNDGTVFPIEMSVNELEIDGVKVYTGVIRDLTSRRNLERQLLESGHEERRKIGRDLHDGLGQMLTGIRMLSENLAKRLKENGAQVAEEMQEIASMIREADEFARTLSRGLVQVDFEKKGLSVALQDLCKRTEKLTGVVCEFFDFEDAEVKNHSLALHLYRIAQEAINNAIKHGNPTSIWVRLSNNDFHTALSVVDDGIGFGEEDGNSNGTGIEIMRHRARVLGGILQISRTADEFTKVRCIVPNNMKHFD